jgi:superfamily II DNA or RNA helicase
MTPLPQDLAKFKKEAEALLQNGGIQALEFSGRTYQVSVYDAKANEAYWAFLHLTPQGDIADSFCLCSDETEADRCVHLAASFLQIYNQGTEPLHVRYERSFWRALGMIFDARFGQKPKALIHPKNRRGTHYLQELFEKGVPPTEETSLKFSDLSEEELKEVSKGHLTPKLHYEFSFWSDFAKHLLMIQEKQERLDVAFEEDEKGLPVHLKVETEDFHFSYTLSQEELLSLIPHLMTVKTPLKIRGGFKDKIENAHFDQERGILSLSPSKFNPQELSGKKVGNWLYVSGEGFFRMHADPRLEQKEVGKEQMGAFLSDYHIKLGNLVHPGQYALKGDLRFDKERRLHLSYFLIEPGDLSKTGSWIFDDWVWIVDQGFYRTLKPKDLPDEKLLEREEVYEWALQHQTFLNTVEGFQVHLTALESDFSWQVDEGGALMFSSRLKGDFMAPPLEFGALVWVEGHGFFSKRSFEEVLAFPSDTAILPYKIAPFIRANEAELKLLSNFFLKRMPIEKLGLRLLLEKGKVVTRPLVELIGEFKFRPFRFYEDYIYVEKEGFFHLSEKHFLPVVWRDERTILPIEYGDFFSKTLDKLEPYLLEIDPHLASPKKLSLLFETEQLFFESEGNRLPFEDFLAAFRSGQRFFFSRVGRLDMHDKRLERLGELFKKSRYPELSLLELLKLQALEDVAVDIEAYKKSRPLDLAGLESRLRPYQETGVQWLWSLYCNQLSGLLCDDMGLGKTHQAMALLAGMRNVSKKPLHFLIVCPTSVLHHWEEKLRQYLPGFKVTVFHGFKRTVAEFEKEEGILLTSYGILRNEIETLKTYRFELAVFDEIQLAKNHLSRLWSALREVRAEMVLGMTGTPIENHLRELKSLFDIVLPPLMPVEVEYVRQFVKPIEKEEDPKAKALLHRYIEPFLLRRKKRDVLLDLPEKIEEISHADLLPSQLKLYHEVFEAARASVIEDLLDEKKFIPYIHIFALLSSLKKICDHPALYLRKTQDYKKYHSGKWELFCELLSEALGSEQKVVVFSHFLGMLDIIESHLTEEGIGFASLRGSTINRGEMIDRFRDDASCKVFVASLQAGGLGIDLTSASVVIHYDRWWNAARENQATDRVHRIGQTRGVQVFKLVTLNTVEERIHTLIEKKQRRMEEIVGVDDAQVIKTLSREELIELLRMG